MKQVKPSVPENKENLPGGKEICRKTGLVSDTFLAIYQKRNQLKSPVSSFHIY
jgi:hypothetical protein